MKIVAIIMDRPTIQIKAPKFELYQAVTLYWNEKQYNTKIVRRWFDLDDRSDGYWWYKVSNDEQFYPEDSLEANLQA
jgi:hypothetical protein